MSIVSNDTAVVQWLISMKTVGIIGFGSFGKFLAEKLSSHARVLVYSQSGKTSSWMTSLKDVAVVDYLILSIPLDAYGEILKDIEPYIGKDTVIVDVCSVKQKPVEIIRRLLPNQPLVATHPMFGPESASASLQGHTFVMCPEVSSLEPYGFVKNFVDSLGLKVIEMSAKEHDKEIAVVQGLTFFIARALDVMNLHDQKLHTPSFQRLLNLAELERHHSAELFKTIQNGNESAGEIRRQFIGTVEGIDSQLKAMKAREGLKTE